MKNKSARHKETNKFKFLPFSERIANIDIDIFHRVGHEYETQVDETESLFYQAITKWDVLNLTEHYVSFRKEVKANNLITLPQLVHNKVNVVQILLKHLSYKNALCLQPLLELVVALANDLRKEFYPYYQEFLIIIIDLLNTKDAEQLEWALTCLAYLFKFLWRPLAKDFSNVFTNLLPLLSDNKPDYINSFAAESFAFVVRKIKDRDAFLNLILKTVKDNQDAISGCGTLLFEVIHGIAGQFHSCAETFLPFLFEALADTRSQNILYAELEEVVTHISTNIHPNKSELFWNTCISNLHKLIDSGNYITFELVLKLIIRSLEHRDGKLLHNPVILAQTTLKLIGTPNLQDSTMTLLSQLSTLMLLLKNISLPQEYSSMITRQIMEQDAILLHFVDSIMAYSSFEALVLPAFLQHCIQRNMDIPALSVLTQLVQRKAPVCTSGLNLQSWVRYPLDFKSTENNKKIADIFMDDITIESAATLLDDYTRFMCAVICLPHINLNVLDCGIILKNNLEILCGAIHKDANNLQQLLFFLLSTLDCAIHVMPVADLAILSDLILSTVLPLTKNVTHLTSLRILDLYLSALNDVEGIVSIDALKRLHCVLESNFNSPFHEVRLLTSHIYTLFEDLPYFKQFSDKEWKIFSLCYKVESIIPQVTTYRDQLQLLENLEFDKQQMSMCKNTEFNQIPLRYLCGVLYMNFQLLWDPVLNIIVSHAHGLEMTNFWKIFCEELRTVVVNIKNNCDIPNATLGSGCEFLEEVYSQVYAVEYKPDYINYRILLWTAMASFPSIAEAKTRDVSELFLNFMANEYLQSNAEIALVWSIKENNKDAILDQSIVNDNGEDNDAKNENVIDKRKKIKPVIKMKVKDNVRSLQHHLNVFTKIRSPKSMFCEPDLYKTYFELLSHKNHDIQKLALDCIMTYKFKYLIPYQEHLYNLINDKNFKDELAAFRVDKESAIIEEHRENLMPVVLKIVYSKMSAKTGLRTGGKASGQFRRNIVLRFLAGCHETEMLNFIRMAFRFYTKYFEDDLEAMFDNISRSVNLDKFIPPKRLQSTLNLLTIVVAQFGRLMGNNLLAFLLKVLFVIAAIIKGALDQVENVHAGYLPILRSARTSCIKILERFFKHFENYPWNSSEINVAFKGLIWPYLDKLVIEGIHSPTPLLKLFIEWGSNPRYFPLLVKHYPNDPKQFVLQHVMNLLIVKQAHGSVVNAIMEMCEKLLSLVPDDEEAPLNISFEDILVKITTSNDKLNYGSCILLPHTSSILEIIKQKLGSKSKNINQCDLFILSRISELTNEPTLNDQVLTLLIPVVLKKCQTGEETVLKYVTSVSNLLLKVNSPQNFIQNLSPLFANVTYISSRKILCDAIEMIAKKFADVEVLAQVVADLNACDTKWVDQPNFQRRIDAFKQVQNLITTNALDRNLGVIIIHNCYYTIQNESDLSLRENAAHCWRNVASALISTYSNSSVDLDYILSTILFATIRKGFQNKNDDVRNECILLLGHLARECPQAHVVLGDLHKLTNKIDVEVDFFENITHLQLHRHARALVKFCQIYRSEENAPSIRTLTQFVLPLVSFYLCTEKFSSKNSLIDAAIDVVAVVCRLLPWHQYEGILKYYLSNLRQKVEFQKQLVRIMVAILDAFHFDLSKGHVGNVQLVELAKEEAEIVSAIVENEKEPVEDDLDEKSDNEIVEDEEDVEQSDNKQKAVDKIKILCQSTANRVIQTIQKVLLPQLHKALAMMTQHESSHKVNRKRTGFEREEEELLRVPISLAVVKLLQQLPKEILESNLPAVFMKLCTFLKSQLESVRRVTRETLQKIMVALGPQYLTLLLQQMTPLLSRGFQVHVLVYTVHSVLLCLKDKYQPMDIDKVLLAVMDLCKVDLFGSLADEKEVEKIGRKVSEAKSTKSYNTLQILATYITDKCLMDIVFPIKTVLLTSRSYKMVHKSQEALRHIAMGLVENEFVTVESLLKFAYGTASESIPSLVPSQINTQNGEKRKNMKKQDCFIIPAAPVGRSGFRRNVVKSSQTANAHIIVEFGLRLCHYLLKKDKLKDDEYKPFIDPFVLVFTNCLNSRHVKLSTLTLQCLSRVVKYDIPAMRANIVETTESLFGILHKYAAAGLSKGDNFELVVAAFKAVSVLVRDVKYHTIETEQLKTLLLYAEQDLHNSDRQATAFTLLRAIISRKLVTPEIYAVMEKVAELSITSELSHVRLQARLVFYHFLMDYPLKTKAAKYIAFYVLQLNYELQSGRESAIEMIQSFITSLPMVALIDHSGTFMITLGARLINDDVAECRKMVADCIMLLFKRLERPDRDPLFDIILLWFKDRNRSHRQLAAQLCGLLVMVEKASFETRLPILMPTIFTQFGIGNDPNKPGRFVLLQNNTDDEDNPKSRVKDHHLFQVLQMLLKICGHCPSFLNPSEDLQKLGEHSQVLLAHPHQWVRLGASQFLGFILSSLDINKVINLITTNSTDVGYLYNSPEETLKSLTLDLCAQLQPGIIESELAEQVIKNLIFAARIVEKLNDPEKQISLIWLCKRMRKIVNTEVVETPTRVVLRTEVFKWIAGIATVLDLTQIVRVLHHLLAPLVREMLTTEEINAPLRQLSRDVGKILKKRVGIDLYTEAVSKSQQHLAVKRAERKRERNQLAVTDPEMYAKKKIKLHEKKKEVRKRKIEQMKGKTRKAKKRKTVDLLDSSEVI